VPPPRRGFTGAYVVPQTVRGSRSLAVLLMFAACGRLPLLARIRLRTFTSSRASAPGSKARLDPAVKTHTKAIKVDVNMCWCRFHHDPLNRLVTGLDRENFNLSKAKIAGDQDFLQRRRSGFDRRDL